MNILGSLGAGSGIDMATLVRDLVRAQREPQAALLQRRQERVEARISALGQFRSALDALNTALVQRVQAGSVSAVPRVSDPTVMSLRVAPGTTLAPQTVEVRAVAAAQVLASASRADPAAPVGQGTLTFRFGTVDGTGPATGFTPSATPDLVVTIGPADDSLTGLRDAINAAARAANAPVTASILTDVDGSRLVLRGTTGLASGFLVEASGDPALEAFAFTVGGGDLARNARAADAELVVDGVTLRRPSNQVSDLLDGATLSLLRAAPGAPVTVSAERSASELAAVVRDFAGALSELLGIGRELSRGETATASAGALVADSTTRRVLQSLTGLTTRPLVTPDGDAPTRLAELGLRLTREGTVQVDEARLQRMVADHPAAVERMVRALADQGSLLTPGGPLRQLGVQLAVAVNGRPGQPTALAREAQAIARARAELDSRMERLEAALTRQFAGVDTAVGRTRATQTFLQQQIDLWRANRDR
ncbi:flagellar filament capping protein FliD [Thermaurantiacus tibetensis]|uniref:flagellar filament capping protein FliD n=1 Tax=Thermaurantiacus tibetensis TaxID=2759035 RepID=UPI00188E4128|nr:flagellar filament capping protein FliD [Thermaurantiacus tibetensis]